MDSRRLIPALLVLSLLISLPSIMRLPRMLPFLNAQVRAAAPQALKELRSKGLWLVNVDLMKINRTDAGVCFVWEHRYRSRGIRAEPETITACTGETGI